MTSTIKIAIISLLFMTFSAHAFSLDYDKKLHLSTSVIISSGAYFMHQGITDNYSKRATSLESTIFSASVCMTAGTIKEVYDEIHGSGFDNKDMAANAAGCALGMIISHSFNSSIAVTPTIDAEGEFAGIQLTKIF